MTKRVRIDGEVVRRERVKRAWTQEQLSERSNLAVRTLRRLEAGNGSLESLRRVAEALDLEPSNALSSADSGSKPAAIPFDLIRIELASCLFEGNPHPFIDNLVERVKSVRRHIAGQLGYLMPGVRFNDFIRSESCGSSESSQSSYRIVIREQLAGTGQVFPGSRLAVGAALPEQGLRRSITSDPTYSIPAVWFDPDEEHLISTANTLIFTPVDVIATHLTHVVKESSPRLLGVEAVAELLDHLNQPRLVAEVVPALLSLTKLRSVLREILRRRHSIVDLALILELLADEAAPEHSVGDLTDKLIPYLGASW